MACGTHAVITRGRRGADPAVAGQGAPKRHKRRPRRSCLMTGRNHTTNGMATITEAASGFPSSNGHIPFECATIAEVLGERGRKSAGPG